MDQQLCNVGFPTVGDSHGLLVAAHPEDTAITELCLVTQCALGILSFSIPTWLVQQALNRALL